MKKTVVLEQINGELRKKTAQQRTNFAPQKLKWRKSDWILRKSLNFAKD
jgi:hypothetical protein